MVIQSPSFIQRTPSGKISKDGLLWPRPNIKTIEYAKTRSTYKVMSGERGGQKHGHSISLLIFDEVSELSDRLLWDSMRHNLLKRRNSLMISISTSGFKRESIAFEQFRYAEKVLAGDDNGKPFIDTSFLPVVYAARPEQAWDSLETFKSCNPSYGVTIQESDYNTLVTEARNEPRKLAAYQTLHLNTWTGFSTAWVSDIAWQSCGENFKEEEFYGQDVWLGYDGSYKGDLCSYVLLAKRDNRIYIMPRFFIPTKKAHNNRDHVPYMLWSTQPNTNLHLTEGEIIDPAYVRQQLERDAKNFRFREIGFDPNTGFEESRQILEQKHGWQFVEVPQRPKYLGGAAGYLERLILGTNTDGIASVRHPNNPILTWCLGNCATKETADGLFVYKGQGDSQRIDGVIATIIGLSRMMVATETGDYVTWI